MAKRYTGSDLDAIQQQFEELLFHEEWAYLLVDKQISARRVLMNAVLAAGVDKDLVHEANDGMDAMAHLNKSETRHVVFLEAKLPDMDAADFITHARTKPGGEKHVFILATGEKNKKRLAPVFQAGAVGYIGKPASPEDVKAQLKSCGVL